MSERVARAGVVTARGVFAQIVNDRAGGCGCLGMPVEAKAGQLGHAKLLAQEAVAVVPLKDPIVESRLDAASALEERQAGRIEEMAWAGEQRFPRAQELEFFADGILRERTAEFGGLKLARGNIHKCNANRRAGRVPRDRGEEIVLARFEDCGIRRRARSNHANDFATHELLAGADRKSTRLNSSH